MEALSLLILIVLLYGMWRFWKPAGEVSKEAEDNIKAWRNEQKVDREERTAIVQQRIQALDEAYPGRVRFSDSDTLFESQVDRTQKKTKK